jgi:DNA polymerase-3 subunit delta'
MALKDIPGNARVRKILRMALARGKVPNSLLFCGPDGVGKRNAALNLAKALNCRTKADDACDACPPCRAIDHDSKSPGNNSFPDVIEIVRENKEVKIEQTRFLKQTAYLRPMTARKRVFIVHEADKMSEESANSVLKVLEEPPLFTYIILITENPHRIAPTILSRCQVLNFSCIAKEEIEKILIDKDYPGDRARILSLLAGGNLERALSLEWEEVQGQRRDAWDLFLSLLRREESSPFLQRFALPQRHVIEEEFKVILEMFASFCRDLILIKEQGDPACLLNPDYEEKLREAEGRLSLRKAMETLEDIDDAFTAFDRSMNINLLASALFLKIEG